VKKIISPILLSAALALVFSGCTVTEKKTIPMNTLDMAVEEVFAEDIMEDVMTESYDILFDAFEYGILKSEGEEEGPKCREKTIEQPEDGKWPRVVTLDFGDSCVDGRGDVRSGKIIITINGYLREEGSTRQMTFEDYYVNGNKIEGEKLLTNIGMDGEFLLFSIELSKSKIIREDGTVIERSASKTRSWIVGEDTREGRDDVFLVNGTVEMVNKSGIQINKTITDLMRARNCRWPLSGIVEISDVENNLLAVIDYGEGECDRFASVTVGEGDDAEVWIINLNKKGKKWRVQDNKDEGVDKEEGRRIDRTIYITLSHSRFRMAFFALNEWDLKGSNALHINMPFGMIG